MKSHLVKREEKRPGFASAFSPENKLYLLAEQVLI
jgi:hypothetical protein